MRPDKGEKSPQVTAADEPTSAPLSLAATQCPTCGLTVTPGTQLCPIDGTPLSDTPAPGLADKYEFLDVLGQGGMAVVHRARHLLLGHTVAIKLLNPNSSYNATTLRRFKQEAAAAKKVEHPNVIRIHDFGITSSGQPFMIMDCLEGETLEERMKKNGAIPVAQAVPLFKQICLALQHMHANNVLHRDLKPSNVFLTRSTDPNDDAPTVKLVDFGIAKVIDENATGSNKLTATGDVFGTPHYMSPEQCQGSSVTAMSDVYSLGCLMYETLSGQPPFQGDNPLAVLHQHLHETPPRLAMDAPTSTQKEIEEIIFKCLEKDAALRYQSASDLLADLGKFETGNFRRQPITHKIKSFVRKRKAAATVGAVTAVAAIAGGAYLFTHPTELAGNHPQASATIVQPIAPHSVVPHWEIHKNDPQSRVAYNDQQIAMGWRRWLGTTNLDFQDSPISASSMGFVSKITTLRDLNLTNCPMGDFGGRYLAELPNLEMLDLTNTNIGDETVKNISGLHNLTTLDLSGSKITVNAFKYLAQLPRLNELYLNSTALTPSDLRATGSLPALTKLHLANMPVTEESLAALPAHLLSLDLQNAGLTDSALKQIDRFWALQNLDLHLNATVTDASLEKIARLNDLETLNVDETGVTAAGLKRLQGLHSLRSLSLSDSRVHSLEPLSGVTSITDLEVRNLGLNDQSLSHLSALKNLQRLYLVGNKISPAGIRRLQTLSTLKVLSVNKEAVIAADGSFRADAAKILAHLPKFEKVMVSGLSVDRAASLSTHLPFTVEAIN